jgi:hypothetical protein
MAGRSVANSSIADKYVARFASASRCIQPRTVAFRDSGAIECSARNVMLPSACTTRALLASIHPPNSGGKSISTMLAPCRARLVFASFQARRSSGDGSPLAVH